MNSPRSSHTEMSSVLWFHNSKNERSQALFEYKEQNFLITYTFCI